MTHKPVICDLFLTGSRKILFAEIVPCRFKIRIDEITVGNQIQVGETHQARAQSYVKIPIKERRRFIDPKVSSIQVPRADKSQE